MRVILSHPADIPGWLALAAEVEPLFGPMVDDPGFTNTLHKNIARGTAFCVRVDDGPPGAPLAGGLLLDPAPPRYEIGWLAVAERARRHGIGQALMEHTLAYILPPAEVILITFANGVEAGRPARHFYEQHGFYPAEPGPPNPAGYPTQVYRRMIGRVPTVRAVIEHKGRYLLAQHNNFIPENIGKWGLPGGRIDPHDPDRPAALRRELDEEFGLAVDIVRFIDTYSYRERLHYVFHVRPRSNGPLTLTIDGGEILDHAWLTVDEIAAWHIAGRLHTGFELAAVRASRTPHA